jgi:CheY-like chemotaxis protein
VLVGVRRRGELLEIQVIDSGIGIAGDKLDAVFGEFTRLAEGARVAEGLGLGLSIVDRIARVLRLEIRIFSVAGKGTRFSVLTPPAQVHAAGRETNSPLPSRPGASLNGLRVLCIDNDTRILDGMRLLLEGWGCKVAIFSGWHAFEVAKNTISAPALILADYHLDDEDGLGVIARLREIYGQATPAILVTADRSNEVRTAAAEQDVVVVNKPLKPAVLRSLMARIRPLAPAAE